MRSILFIFPILLLSACAGLEQDQTAEPAKAADKPEPEKIEPLPPSELAAGYALLAKLMSDEKDVSKLLIIKRETSELHELIKRISETCKQADEHLVALRGKGGADGLPAVETAARKLISRHRAKELIFQGGKDFELKMLLSQNEALSYGAALAEALSQREPDPTQKEWLLKLSKSLSQLQQDVFQFFFRHHSR